MGEEEEEEGMEDGGEGRIDDEVPRKFLVRTEVRSG